MDIQKKWIMLCIVPISVMLCIGAILGFLFRGFAAPDKKSHHLALTAYPFEEEGAYSEYEYEAQRTPDRLFGEGCKDVFYGKIIDIELFRTNTVANSAGENTNSVYAYALLRIKVMKNICGELSEGDETYVVLPYSGQAADEEEIIREGREGMFIPKMPAVDVTFKESGKMAEAIGMVGWIDCRFCYEEEYQRELRQMNTLDEVKKFWEENGLCLMGGPAE